MNADDESQEQSSQIKASALITIPSKIIEISMNTKSPCILHSSRADDVTSTEGSSVLNNIFGLSRSWRLTWSWVLNP